MQFVISFVYGLNTAVERRELWNKLARVNHSVFRGTAWSILGDFNVCLGPSEPNKGLDWNRSMLDFRDFFITKGLVDLNISGRKFTWWGSNNVDPCYKRLDMCLVNGEWLINFALSKALVLVRGLSDHCPNAVSIGIAPEQKKKIFPIFYSLERQSWIS